MRLGTPDIEIDIFSSHYLKTFTHATSIMLHTTNPATIQRGSLDSGQASTPLVLIHDGGGTCCSYYNLGDLKRTVYGISNPRFTTGRPWKGGISEMAKVYINLIRTVIPRGPIIVGGWSLGGMIALEIASLLRLDDTLEVVGVCMLDSFCPFQPTVPTPSVCKPSFPATCRADIRFAILRSFRQSGDLIRQWTIPRWPDQDKRLKRMSLLSRYMYEPGLGNMYIGSGLSSSTLSNASRSSTPPSSAPSPGNLSYDDSVAPELLSSRLESYIEGRSTAEAPPVVLLKASQCIRSQPGTRIDADRTEPLLGWTQTGILTCAIALPGDHFSILDEYARETTSELTKVCQWIDSL